MLIVNFAFSGTAELIGVAAGEAENPAKTVPKAINAAIWRLLIFFVGTIVVISSLLPYHLAGLSANDVSSSPFVTVFNYIGIPYAEDIIRFVIITALLSAANSGLFAASRMMWSFQQKINYLKFCRSCAVWNTYYCHCCDNVWCYSGLLRIICTRNIFKFVGCCCF